MEQKRMEAQRSHWMKRLYKAYHTGDNDFLMEKIEMSLAIDDCTAQAIWRDFVEYRRRYDGQEN